MSNKYCCLLASKQTAVFLRQSVFQERKAWYCYKTMADTVSFKENEMA